MIGPLFWYQIWNCNNFDILNFQLSEMSSYSWICHIDFYMLHSSADPGGCFGGCSTPGYESQKKKKKREKKERKKERKEEREWFSGPPFLSLTLQYPGRKQRKKEREWFIISSKMPSISKEKVNCSAYTFIEELRVLYKKFRLKLLKSHFHQPWIKYFF